MPESFLPPETVAVPLLLLLAACTLAQPLQTWTPLNLTAPFTTDSSGSEREEAAKEDQTGNRRGLIFFFGGWSEDS